jgi:RND family efflux transporter MFP subunit
MTLPFSVRLLVAGALLGGFTAGCSKPPPHTDDNPPPAPVKAVAPQRLSLGEWTELFGTTQPLPNRSARLSAAVEGRVLTVLGDGKGPTLVEGQEVSAGEVIVQLDDRIARANRERVAAAQDEISQQLKQADLAIELAKIEVKRLEELARTASAGGPLPLVSRIELDKARIALRDAEARQKGVTAKGEAGKAELAALKEQLDFFTIRAPIKGRLGAMQVVPGQTLTVGTPVGDIVDLNEVDVLCFVPQHTTALLQVGQAARIVNGAAPADEEKAANGKIAFIAVQAQPETGNFAVKVRFPNPGLKLSANRVLRVQVLTTPRKERLTIPDAALLEDQEPPLVVVVQDVRTEKKDGKDETLGTARKLRPVLGVRDRSRHVVEIVGLEDPESKENEKKEKVTPEKVLFVVEGAHGLQSKDEVKVEPPEHKDEK